MENLQWHVNMAKCNNDYDVASWDTKRLFEYLKRIKVLDGKAKYADYKDRKVDMLSMVYAEILEIETE